MGLFFLRSVLALVRDVDNWNVRSILIHLAIALSNMREFGAAAYQLGNTSYRMITEVKRNVELG